MSATTSDQSPLWPAVRRGWKAGLFVPNVATSSAHGTPGRRPIHTKNPTSRLPRRRATRTQPSIGWDTIMRDKERDQ